MCGRYYIASDDGLEALHELVAEAQLKAEKAGVMLKTGEIFPSDVVPVIANDRKCVPGVFPMAWGFPRPGGGLVINARSETAAARPMFRESARLRRCLIPATDYFEWAHGEGRKVKYAIRPSGAVMLYMGGLYTVRPETPPARFVILTRPTAGSIAFIHDRMPVIVSKDNISSWLSPQVGFEEAIKAADGDMEFRAV
jgi:putative SOS response-associated peptidase YedK